MKTFIELFLIGAFIISIWAAAALDMEVLTLIQSIFALLFTIMFGIFVITIMVSAVRNK